jgi:hypothetical protein
MTRDALGKVAPVDFDFLDLASGIGGSDFVFDSLRSRFAN